MLERDTGNYQTTMFPTQGRFEEEIEKQKGCKCQTYDNFQMEAKLTIPNEDIPKNATLRGIRIEDEYGNICLQIPNPVLHCNSHGDNTFEKINIQVPCDYQNQGTFSRRIVTLEEKRNRVSQDERYSDNETFFKGRPQSRKK